MRPVSTHAGYTLVEMQIVIALIAIVGGMAALSLDRALPAIRGDAAMDQVVAAMRYGREAAITQRRSIDVVFVEPNRIRLLRNEVAGGTTAIGDITLEHGARFVLPDGVTDTPDGFGAAAAIDFDGAATLRFLADGTFTDARNVPLNGTVFLSIAGDARSSRAVTITGGTGRAAGYRWNGRSWEAQS